MLGLAFPKVTQQVKNATVQAALEGGINWFDTAELYGLGVSEAALAAALKAAGKTDGEVLVATKWWPFPRTARNIPRTIDERLRCLDGYPIGLYMVHQPISFSTPEAEMDAMADLVALCAASPWIAEQLARHPVLLDELLDGDLVVVGTRIGGRVCRRHRDVLSEIVGR